MDQKKGFDILEVIETPVRGDNAADSQYISSLQSTGDITIEFDTNWGWFGVNGGALALDE